MLVVGKAFAVAVDTEEKMWRWAEERSLAQAKGGVSY
jgi:hypothetical protein